MNMKFIRLVGSLGAGILFLSVVGCAVTHTIKTSEIPPLQTGSSLRGVKSRTFAFKNFRDSRGVQPHLVLHRLDQGGMGNSRTMVLDQPVSVVVSNAIRDELERNGHECFQYLSENNPDFIVMGTVYKFWLMTDHSLLSEKATGNVAIKLTIENTSNDKLILTKKYEGEYSLSGGYIGNEDAGFMKEYEKILIKALLEMLKEMTFDPELVEFIGK